MDYELYIRLARSGYRPLIVNEPLACFRSQEKQKSKDFPIRFWREELIIVQRLIENTSGKDRRFLMKYSMWLKKKISNYGFNKFIRKVYSVTIGKREETKYILKFFRRLKDHMTVRKGKISKKIIMQYLPENPVIVEAGAHIGVDTLEMSRLWPTAYIHAIEPVPEIYRKLTKNVGGQTNVTCYPLALGSSTGHFKMFVSTGASDGRSSLMLPKQHLIDHPDVKFESEIVVEVFTLDDWAVKFGIKHVDLLWLDLQGLEQATYQGASRTLKTVNAIYSEVNLKENYEGVPLYKELRDWLEKQGFSVEIEAILWADGGNVLFIRNMKS